MLLCEYYGVYLYVGDVCGCGLFVGVEFVCDCDIKVMFDFVLKLYVVVKCEVM